MAATTGLKIFRPATAGIFDVAAAVGKLVGFDHVTLLDAFVVAQGQGAGSMQVPVQADRLWPCRRPLPRPPACGQPILPNLDFLPQTMCRKDASAIFNFMKVHGTPTRCGRNRVRFGASHRLVINRFAPAVLRTAGTDGILQPQDTYGVQADPVERLTLRDLIEERTQGMTIERRKAVSQ